MKILYIGHYRQGTTGWAIAGQNYILAMDSVGLDVVPRPILLDGATDDIPTRIKELEQKSDKSCDICIQHVLPHYMTHHSHFKNIGIIILESHNLKYNPWTSYINLMDEGWVTNQEEILNAHNNGIKIPLKVVPHAFNLEKYDQEYYPLDISDLTGNYVFYYIGELSKRKNIEALVTAFQAEFRSSEPVALLLKLSRSGQSPEQVMQQFSQLSHGIRNDLRLYINPHLYKDEIVISQRLSEHDLYRLHKNGDCFVCTSYGEAWSIPAFESLVMGNMAIAPDYGPFQLYVHPDFLIECSECIPLEMHETFPGYNNARERFYEINIPDLMCKMRWIYENRYNMEKYRAWYKEKLKGFSYESVGNKIKGLLNG